MITGRELDQRAGLIARRLQQQNAPVPPTDQLRAQVLNQMVLERIQVQKAKDDGIRIDDATVQATLQRLAQANGMTLEQYRARLEAQGVPGASSRATRVPNWMLSKLREREVDGKITVSDAEVANYIASRAGHAAASRAGERHDARAVPRASRGARRALASSRATRVPN